MTGWEPIVYAARARGVDCYYAVPKEGYEAWGNNAVLLKGAVSRVAEGGTAFGNRQASHAITLDGVWRPGEDFGDRDTAWTRGFFAALGRFREGVYVNFLGGDEDPNRVREAYGDSVYDRLVDVKTTYDPDNVFHHNQNIRPRH